MNDPRHHPVAHHPAAPDRGSLIDDLLRRPMSRRDALARAGAAGLSISGISAIAAACGGTNANAGGSSGQTAAKVLTMTSGATPVTLDPGVSLDGQSPLLWRCVYEPLLQFKGSTIDVEPRLAQAYELDNAKNTLVFHLRPDVSFTDGTALDAAAVKLNIERQIAVKQGIAYALSTVKSVEAPDDQGARRALLSVLAHAVRADRAPVATHVQVLDHTNTAAEIADLAVTGRAPSQEQRSARSAEAVRAYEDWRTELFGLARAEI